MVDSKKRVSIVELVIVSVFALMLFAVPIYNYATVGSDTFTVDSKERVNTKDSSYYLVFTDQGVFKNTDSWLFLKFSSSDLQGEMKVGETFTCTTNKLRIPFLSMYKNIISCDK